MKFKVSSTMKGKICFGAATRDFKADEVFDIPEDRVSDSDIQFAMKNGIIKSLDNLLPIKHAMVEFRNLTDSTIIIGSTGIRASANEKFDVLASIVDSEDIQSAIKSGHIIQESLKNKVKQSGKKMGRPKKSEKAVEENTLDDSSTFFKVPKGVTIARPDLNSESPSSKINAILDLDRDDNDSGLKFVDKEQAKEKMLKLQKIIKKNS